jgi:hypothetical protein
MVKRKSLKEVSCVLFNITHSAFIVIMAVAVIAGGCKVRKIEVPDLLGMTEADAVAALSGAGLVGGDIIEEHSDTVPAGEIIALDPPPGDRVQSGTAVNLIISLGPEPPKAAVPNVAGRPRYEAEDMIQAAGLSIGAVNEQASTTVLPWEVISQNPAAGEEVSPGDRVDITISAAPVWHDVYGNTGIVQNAADILQTADGGYLIAGETNVYGDGLTRGMLIRLDSNGDELWRETYTEPGETRSFSSINPTADGGFILSGERSPFSPAQDTLFAMKVDAGGKEVWSNDFNGNYAGGAVDALETGTGGYTLLGNVNNTGSGTGYDGFLIFMDAAGAEQSTAAIGGAGDEFVHDFIELGSGDYIIAGSTTSYGAGVDDGYLVKTDAAGNELWHQTYGCTLNEYFLAVTEMPGGGFAMAGYTGSFGVSLFDAYFVTADASGNKQLEKTFGGAGYDAASDIVARASGDFVIAGYTNSFGNGNNDIYLQQIDSAGNAGNAVALGSADHEYAGVIRATADGGYITAGGRHAGQVPYTMYIVKITASLAMDWDREIGPTYGQGFQAVEVTSDGGYIAGGWFLDFSGNRYLLAAKLGAWGDIAWKKEFGSQTADSLYSVVPCDDGGYLLCGRTPGGFSTASDI